MSCVIKVTSHLYSNRKKHFFVEVSAEWNWKRLVNYIEDCLFIKLGYSKCDIRLYWIDGSDEIEVFDNIGLNSFIAINNKLKQLHHLHVANYEDNNTVKMPNTKPTISCSYSMSNHFKETAADFFSSYLASEDFSTVVEVVARESAVQLAKYLIDIMFPCTSSTAAQTKTNPKEKEATNYKVDATTVPQHGFNTITTKMSSAFLETDKEKVSTSSSNDYPDLFDPNKSDDSFTNLTKSFVLPSIEKQNKKGSKGKRPISNISTNKEFKNVGNDSETDSASETFAKMYVPKKRNKSVHSTPPKLLNVNFDQPSDNLIAPIPEKDANNASISIETGAGVTTSTSANTANTSTANEEMLAEPVYHAGNKNNDS